MARLQPLSPAELEKYSEDIDRMEKLRGHPLNNCFRTMARKPKLLRVINEMSSTVMRDPGQTTLALRWMVAHVVSNAAGCRYCTAHTVRNAAMRGDVPDEKLQAIWEFQTNSLFSNAERAALGLALAAGSCPAAVDDAHFIELRRHYDDEAIVEIVAVISMFGWFNRWNDTMGSDLEDSALDYKQAHPIASGWRTPAQNT